MGSSSVATIFRPSERWGAICYWKTRGRSGVVRTRCLVLSAWCLVLAVGTSVPSTLNLYRNLVLASHKPMVVDEFYLKLTKVW